MDTPATCQALFSTLRVYPRYNYYIHLTSEEFARRVKEYTKVTLLNVSLADCTLYHLTLPIYYSFFFHFTHEPIILHSSFKLLRCLPKAEPIL